MRVHPTMVPVAPPARVGARLVQRGVHRGRRGRRADVLRPRRRRRAHRVARCSATSSTRRRTCVEGRKGATIGTLAPQADPRRSTRSSRSSTCSSRWPTGPVCSPTIAGEFGEHGVSIQSMQQSGHRRRRPAHLRHPHGARGRPARDGPRALRDVDAVAPGRLGAAGDRRRGVSATAAGRGPGSSRRTASTCPVTDAHAGRSRCSRATRRCSTRRGSRSELGLDVYLKVEGANPTGSFKDRGMTMAISKAVEAGAKVVVCASTGNTSASAAAYAARAGLIVRGRDPARARSRSASSRRR